MGCATTTRQLLLISTPATSRLHLSSSLPFSRLLVTSTSSHVNGHKNRFLWLCESSSITHRNLAAVSKSSPADDSNIVAADDDGEDGVSLGTLKLPSNTNLDRFETLLFQWANSLCQGANLPLPVPLKVDKIAGGARLGFISIDDGKTEVLVYIDCLVFPASGGSGPIFRAIRNGPLKDKSPPGEPRIMKSLLAALQKSVAITTA
ncbi:hypothetical protein Tsubulata_001332 [Turnera subulata]|uniref:DUF7148 domain-containing protein n=1 Tax=Turnera subulata TaxID=218843 RepID=A0A9Q0FEQ5_9ROSI|nr:hypothetical protein Tsubulata_001332 [Turnera subulata]